MRPRAALSFNRTLTLGVLVFEAGCADPLSLSRDASGIDAITEVFSDALTDSGMDVTTDVPRSEVRGDVRRSDAPHDLSPPPEPLAVSGPARLSETGLYSDIASRRLSEGVTEFTPRYELWSDGSEKRRYLWLPPGTQIDTTDMNHWVFPVGTRVWKSFRVAGRLVETRILQKVGLGLTHWWMVSYLWNSDESDALATPEGMDAARGTSHRVPPQSECVQCHRSVRDVIIGVSALELAGGEGPGSLRDFISRGLLSTPPGIEPRVPGEGVVQAALGYMHANCGFCHNDESYFHTESVLRLRLLVSDRDPLATASYRSSIRVPMYHDFGGINLGVVPGAPEQSQLFVRMGLRNETAMPPIGTLVQDPGGMAIVREWINALP